MALDPWVARIAATAALVLLSAKTHGRQVRLLRERHGVARVEFHADNGSVVESIWRTDRWVLWSTTAAVAVPAELFVLFGALTLVDLFGYGALFLAFALSGGFAAAGVWALLKGQRTPPNLIHPRTGIVTGLLWSGVAAVWALALAWLWE